MTAKPSVASRLHDELHELPGMPSHDQAAANNSHANANPSHRSKATKPHASRQNHTRSHGNPRVLVAWQNRIARFFGQGD